jgi:subtilisin family serine protease
MKRPLFIFIAIVTLTAGFAQMSELPGSVRMFLDEREMMKSLVIKKNDKDAAMFFKSRFAPTRVIGGKEMADVFIDFDNPKIVPVLKSKGVIVNCVFDRFLTAQVPIDQLNTVSQIKGVIGLEISGVAELCSDSTLSVTHAGQVLNGTEYGLPQAYDGTGVIIGMIDTGFDYQHTAFRRSDDPSKTRIVRVYDPNNTTGYPAIINGENLPGSIFMNEQIDTLTTDSYDTHGTNTTGVAAGRNVNGYGGTAPGAEIVLCTSRTLHSGISELEVINCIKYIYAYADSVGKPCVINISMSNRFGPHDGKDRVSAAIAQSVGPGRIFVVAAGNNGNSNDYAFGPALANKPLNMLMGHAYVYTDDSYYYANTWMTTWVRANNVRPVIQFHILDKWTKHIVWESDLISSYQKITSYEISKYYEPDPAVGPTGYISALVALNPFCMKFEASCEFKNLRCKEYTYYDWGQYVGRYQIGVSVYPPSVRLPRQPDSCYVDSWVCTVNGRRTNYPYSIYRDIITEEGDTVTQLFNDFYTTPSNRCSVGTYTVNDSIISVGGYYGRDSYFSMPDNQIIRIEDCTVGQHMWMSSYEYPGYGPTGKALPTITAPGISVISAANHLAGITDSTMYTIMRVGDDYWSVLTGTSMAAPAVAGIIAQWLQINPNLSPSQVKDILAQTAIKDSFTNDPGYGVRFGPNGKVDAMAGVRLLLGLDDEEEILRGDVNGDGIINITDLTWLIDYMLGIPDPDFVIEAADVHADGILNIEDVSYLIDLMIDFEI